MPKKHAALVEITDPDACPFCKNHRIKNMMIVKKNEDNDEVYINKCFECNAVWIDKMNVEKEDEKTGKYATGMAKIIIEPNNADTDFIGICAGLAAEAQEAVTYLRTHKEEKVKEAFSILANSWGIPIDLEDLKI